MNVLEELIRIPRGIVLYHKGVVSTLQHLSDLRGLRGHYEDLGW